MKEISCCLISVGDEILYGQIHNTNVQYISQLLSGMGIRVHRHITLPDEREAMLQSFRESEKLYTLTIITGGLGPTADDLTKPLLAEMYGSEMHMHEEALAHIKALFEQRNRNLSELNRQQALLPDACTYLPNRLGTAPGMWFERNGKIMVSLPGVPYEMQTLMEEQVTPRLRAKLALPVIFHSMLRTAGVPESKLAAMIQEWENQLPQHIKLAYLPRLGQVRLRLTAFGEHKEALKQEVEKEFQKVLPIIEKYAFGYDDNELEAVIGNLLKKRNLQLATAESCTGGFIAHKITSIAGSSAYYRGTIIPYHNAHKVQLLGVKEETLKQHGAVSEACVIEMAEGAAKTFGTEVAIASSGIAGPDGGTSDKPVGTIWIAAKTPDGIYTRLLQLTKDRMLNIELTTTAALYWLWRHLK
jgi:nicotinamide-nucleotide amidase